jgi:radical SAM superfamily enzyme YgiQ (UPF0313 family)
MKIMFVQLPVQEPDWEGVSANVPLAAGYLATYAESIALIERKDWEILDRDTSSFGSDSAIIDAIASREPDLVSFSLYAWNLNRSLHIASHVKERLPRARIVAGGPEVVDGMPIMDHSPFTALVVGEGEIPFVQILRDVQQHKPLAKRYFADTLLDLTQLPNPYLSGALSFLPDTQVHLETMRGCPYKCAYCYYGKNFQNVRRFPHIQTMKTIEAANAAGVNELYLMDPSFQIGGDFEQRLKDMAEANSSKMAIHTELRLESVTEEIGILLKHAGIASVEVGLQSVNQKALDAVHRTFNKKAFENGAEILQRNRIITKTGLILGLPYDGYEQVTETFDFLGMQGLGQESELYPLSLLPGTEAREHADDWGMSRMDTPPYWVTSTDWISNDDMIDAIATFEDSFDREWASPPSPHFVDNKSGFRAFVDTRKSDNIDWMRLNPDKMANSITLLADADDPETLSRLVRVARDLRRDNPYSLYQIVLMSETRIPSEKLTERIQDAFLFPDHYYQLSRYLSPDPQEGFQTRMYFATKNFSLAYRAMEEAQDLETMVILSARGGYNAERLSELLPYVIFDKSTIPFDRLYELLGIYADFPNLLIEAPTELF